ncbi:MAG: TAXI family TRAP transporter solute-binding subunit [Acidaminococcus sp.]|jgi:TRAP transporter TAXI family solute receptor|nr:TAXI family TRAP transporter solute-binding subunit [Acidaminococcus sp.]MCI2099430.1 TAXI family TRAP transporter solute-binding subunit [Acidaminococcus sp.]MCI2113790.1 TAXI family TRAP transporter solute-binding subunit [Acidaminococcus sp.]MCI2115636.1 TAXI family TRAP transporter solute-binding subunit [Acidaminococcus sp.]
MKKSFTILTLICCLLLGAGCHKEAKAPKPVNEKPAVMSVRIGAGNVPGVYARIGSELDKLLKKELPDAADGTLSSNGSIANVELLHQKKVELALTQEDVAELAFAGKGPFAGRPFQDIRQIASLHLEALHFIVPFDSPIRSVADLKKKRIALNAPGSGSEVTVRKVLQAWHLTDQDVDIQYLPEDQILKGLEAGTLDAAFIITGFPSLELKPYVADHKVRLVSLEGPQLASMFERYGYYHPVLMGAGTYKEQNNPVVTLGVRCLLVCTESTPKEITAAAASVICAHLEDLKIADEAFWPLEKSDLFPVLGVPMVETSKEFKAKVSEKKR